MRNVSNTRLFQKILDTLPNNVYLKDKDGRYVWLNESCIRLLASQHQIVSSIIDKTDFDVFPEKSAVEYVKNDKTVMEARAGTVIEEEVLLPTGEHLIQLSFKEPLIDEETNDVLGIVGYTIDISDQKRAEQALIKAKEAEELAIKAKEELLYNLRHDIRTPFAGMRLLLADYLRSDESDSTECHALHLVHQTANELFRYMDKILELTEVEAADVPVVSQSVNLKTLGKQCADMHLPVIKEKGLQFFYDYDDRLPEQLFSDGFRLKRILINLFGNAVKFTDKGYIRLSIMLESDDPASDDVSVALSVQDTGVGIPEDKQTLIFGKFEQLNSTNEGKYKGSGFGLFAVRLLASELGGEVKLKSVVSEGSTFTCCVSMRKHGESAS